MHIVTVTGSDGGPVTAHPRVLVVAGDHSQVRIGHTFIGVANSVYFNNSVAEVVVGEGAVVDYYTDQRESDQAFHVANLQAHVSARGVAMSASATAQAVEHERDLIEVLVERFEELRRRVRRRLPPTGATP